MNLRQLRYFAKIVELGNITRAAEQLYVAQPALGLQIRALENDLRVSLLVRHSRGVTPTAAGELLYKRATEILRAVSDAKKEISSFGGPEHESIVLGLSPGVMNLLGRDILVEAREHLPGVSLSLVEEMSYVLIEALERDEVDIALAYEAPERPGLIRVPIIEEELLFISANPITPDNGDTIDFTTLIRQPLALATGKDVVRQLFGAAAERLTVMPNIAFEASSVGVMKNLVSSGAAASIMPYGTVINELERSQLHSCRISNPTLKRTLYLIRPTRLPAFRNEDAVIDLINSAMEQLLEKLGRLATPLTPLSTALAAQ
ncbi:LysR substrate-binding domain-containing protein [Corticibacterium sp. UT-5YL-CI-8]|nr:LysR substrate-binding domain-containing protein [Tianweitania sp. UT-5YL-CI-8]